jgi:long-chain acyl-CoA synthetase
MIDGTVDGYEPYEDADRGPARRAADEPGRRQGHALQLGHHRPAQGRQAALPSDPLGTSRPRVTACSDAVRQADETMSTCPPRRSTTPRRCASAMGHAQAGGTVVVMEHFDPRRRWPSSSAPGHPQPVGADHVRPHAEAARGVRASYDVSSCRWPSTPPRRARSRSSADDRVVGPGHPRVLRRHRGQRLRLLQQRGLAGPQGHGRQALLGRSTSSTRTARRCPSARRAPSTSRARTRVRVPQRSGEDGRVAQRPGWSTLGDVGRLDEDGFLYLTDRKAYMIITGGVNVYPQEAENVLAMHPKVLDVAVFGVPNEDFGEEVKAVVQPPTASRPGPSSSASSSPSAASTWPTSSALARSTSATSCPATRPASSTSACSATSTGPGHQSPHHLTRRPRR